MRVIHILVQQRDLREGRKCHDQDLVHAIDDEYISRSSTSLAPAVRRLKIDKRRLCMAVAALVVAVSSAACRSSSPNDPPLPLGHSRPTTTYRQRTLTCRPARSRLTSRRPRTEHRHRRRIPAHSPETLYVPTLQSRFHRPMLATGRVSPLLP